MPKSTSGARAPRRARKAVDASAPTTVLKETANDVVPKYKGPFILLATLLLLLGGLASFGGSRPVEGQAIAFGNISGYAWSDTIGWISFNCLNPGNTTPCDQASWGVAATGMSSSQIGSINGLSSGAAIEADGNVPNGLLAGYAWSDNIGWISFGCGQNDGTTARKQCSESNSSGAPTYPNSSTHTGTAGTVASGASLTGSGTSRKLVGWARACSVFAGGCSGTLKTSDKTGGWDGWISLGGSVMGAGAYGITINPAATGKAFNFQFGCTNPGTDPANQSQICKDQNYAWGNEVVGWVNFNPGRGDGVYVGRPELSVSCTVASGSATKSAIWTATVGGGLGPYTYEWFESKDSTNPSADPLFGQSGSPYLSAGAGNPSNKTYTLAAGDSSDHYDRYVKITDQTGSTKLSSACIGPNGLGITIRESGPNFSLVVQYKDGEGGAMNAEILGGQTTESSSTPAYIIVSTDTQRDVTFVGPVTVYVTGATESTASRGFMSQLSYISRAAERVLRAIGALPGGAGGAMARVPLGSGSDGAACFSLELKVDGETGTDCNPGITVTQQTYSAADIAARGIETDHCSAGVPCYPKIPLTMSVHPSTRSGIYNIAVNGDSGTITRSASPQLKVNSLGSSVEEF